MGDTSSRRVESVPGRTEISYGPHFNSSGPFLGKQKRLWATLNIVGSIHTSHSRGEQNRGVICTLHLVGSVPGEQRFHMYTTSAHLVCSCREHKCHMNGAGVFGLIGCQSPSPGLALPIFFNNNNKVVLVERHSLACSWY